MEWTEICRFISSGPKRDSGFPALRTWHFGRSGHFGFSTPMTTMRSLPVRSRVPWNGLGAGRGGRRIPAFQLRAVYRDLPDVVWVNATPFWPSGWGFDPVGRNRPRILRYEGRLLPADALPDASLARADALRAVGRFDESQPVACTSLGGSSGPVGTLFGSHALDPPA
jgi:hypothetical protein